MFDDTTKAILKTLSVLYVEDEEDIRTQLLDSFQRKFGQTFIAANGAEGLELFHKHKPDIVITDLKMPVMDGLSMIERIREEDENTPIIVVTAYGDLDNLKRAIELDVDRFIPKPPIRKEIDRALYKATNSIVKQKEIDDRDRIIQTILGWQPYFSIICNETDIQHITSDFLGFLGYLDHQNFLKTFKDMTWRTMADDVWESVQFAETHELFSYLSQEKGKKHFVLLKNKSRKSQELFEVRARFFEHTHLYLLSLFTTQETLP